MTKDEVKSAPDFDEAPTAVDAPSPCDPASEMSRSAPRPRGGAAHDERRLTNESGPRGLIARYRSGVSVTALANEVGASFDRVAQLVMAAGARPRPAAAEA